MIDYNEAFRKIDKWCRENIKYPVHAKFHNLRMEVRASATGVMVIDDSYFNEYGSAFTADGKDWSIHYTGSSKMEEHLLSEYREQYIKKFVTNWHSGIKEKLLLLQQKEIALDNFEA